MTRSLLILSLAALAACGGDKTGDDTGGETGSGNGGGGCDVTIKSTIPANNATDAYYRGNIYFTLSDADPTATVSSSIAGTQTVSGDGKTIIYTPSAALSPSTSYSVTLSYCGGDATIDFTTSAVGTSTDAKALVGHAYALDLAAANIVEPAGISAVLSQYLTTAVLVGVQDVSGGQIQMIGAIGAEGVSPAEQDYCTPSIDFPSADFAENPFFSIGPQDTVLAVAGYEIEIKQLNVTGSFAPDASEIAGATLSGTIDTRPLAPLIDPKDPNAICALAVNFGAECIACSDGQPYCLTLVADSITGTAIADALVPVAGSDCEGCESGPPAPDAVCAE